ncbi:hypothetical protein THYS13_12650 [Thermoanaerobacter sp. YS13]|uniref:hypothetical protein n=1 Tax=Thermoanaerobacter sp. YS13 TaxID=1511746 RepID=UPI0005751119|nr:hypothetical protein [Thermoanaerobacter sp. YS13]KHO63155.1 hypothetical protein THYS13_12650 [Thermoanaerobacter sp. YS13]
MNKINFQKEIWEGWTIKDFIRELEPQLDAIQSGRSWYPPITTKKELKNWCKQNQSYYKKTIPEVVQYFSKKYNLK